MLDKLFAKIKRELFRHKIREFSTSPEYWEKRYRLGGTSGRGSYGDEARFKADFINRLLAEHGIERVIDFGCGDGNNISLIEYPHYLGLDVAKTAVSICGKKFAAKPHYRFVWNDPGDTRPTLEKLREQGIGDTFDLAQSLDVVYHLVEDDIFDRYMNDLFQCSRRHVLIYTSNRDGMGQPHVRHRDIVRYVDEKFPDYALAAQVLYPAPDEAVEPKYFLHFVRSA